MTNTNKQNNGLLAKFVQTSATLLTSFFVIPFVSIIGGNGNGIDNTRNKSTLPKATHSKQLDRFTTHLRERFTAHQERDRLAWQKEFPARRHKIEDPTDADRVFDEVIDSVFPPKRIKPRSCLKDGVLTTYFDNLTAHQQRLVSERLTNEGIDYKLANNTITLDGSASVQARKKKIITGSLKADYQNASTTRRYLPSQICNQKWYPMVSNSGEIEMRAAISTLKDKESLYEVLHDKNITHTKSVNGKGTEYIAIKGDYAVEMYQASMTNKRLKPESTTKHTAEAPSVLMA